MDQKYDLTSKAGIAQAIDANELILKALGLHPAFFLVGKAIDAIASAFDVTPTIREQRETAEVIIKAGKENGVDSVEFTMEQEAGLSLKAKLGTENIDARLANRAR